MKSIVTAQPINSSNNKIILLLLDPGNLCDNSLGNIVIVIFIAL
jgi:hypothetical protein